MRLPYTPILMVITPETAKYLPKSVAYFLDMGARFVVPTLNYGADWDERAMGVLARAYRRVARDYVRRTRRGQKFYLSMLDAKIASRARGPCSEREKCSAGKWDFSVAPSGAKKNIGFEFVTEGDYVGGYWSRPTADMPEAQRKRVEAYRAKALSFDEMAKLEALATDKQGYVAVINHRNYPYGWMAVHSDPRVQAKYKEQAAAKGNAEKMKKIRAEITKLRAKIIKKGKQVALEKLEKDVRGYLAWLKKQGAL